MKTSLTRLLPIVLVTFAIVASVLTTLGQSRRVAPTPTPPRADEPERVVIEEIKLNVLAFDEAGKFFRDVTDRDLVISENNILHQPESVRRLPAHVLIVMDTGGELRSVKTLDQTRRVARGVVEALRPGDFVSIMTYADRAEIVSEWTDDKTQMLAAIKRTHFGRKSVFVDALRLATDFLQRDPIENKHLVLITDGTDSAGRSSAKFDAFQRLLSTDISVHVLSYTALETKDVEPRTKSTSKTPPPPAIPPEIEATLPNGVRKTGVRIGPTINLDRTLLKKMRARQNDLEISQEQLEKLAENTNGEFILPLSTDEMIDKAALVARMIDSSYVVTYTPKIPVADTRGIAERTIDVTSKRPGLVVQARRKLVVDTSRK